MSKYVGATNERIYLLCLDNKLKLLNCMLMGEGSLNKVGFHPRRIWSRRCSVPLLPLFCLITIPIAQLTSFRCGYPDDPPAV